MYPVSRDRRVQFCSEWDWRDLLLLLALLASILGIIGTVAQFGGSYDSNLQIETSLNVLSAYTAQTLLRMVVAYFLALVFTLVYAYIVHRLPYPTSATHPRQRSVFVQWLNWLFWSGVP